MARTQRRAFVLSLVLLALAWPATAPRIAWAAQMEARPGDGGAWIFIRGPLVAEDGTRFRRLLANTPYAAMVALESDGGSLLAGTDIGTAIRTRQLATVVRDFSRCASSCALAWLGGTRRYMGTGAHIGFHAAYRLDADRNKSESAVGNALLGAYLSRLGLSDRAVVHITAAAPNQITWLTLRDARALEIEVSPTASAPTSAIANQGAAAPRAAIPTERAQAGMEQIAQNFPYAFYEQATQAPAIAMAYFESAYADEVKFNDSPQPRAYVLAIRRRLAQRWPEQAYTIRADTVQVKCNRMAGSCEVGGIMDWTWSSWGRGARAAGSARFWFQLAIENDRPRIRAESSFIITRESSGPQ